MPLYKLTEESKKEYAKKYLENLEYWLRRVIDQQLSADFGNDFINYQSPVGHFLIKKEIRDSINSRFQKHPERFSRIIDASLLEHLIYIICKEDLYQKYFRPFFESNYPLGRIQLKNTLEDLSEIRNRLYHINPISIRHLEKVICYSNDIIESIKIQYSNMNQEKKFNVPTILSYSDSLGQHFLRENIDWATNCLIINNRGFDIYCNDTVSLQIEVDPSFHENEYDLIWKFDDMEVKNQKNIEINFEAKHVGELKSVVVKIISKNEWHKLNGCDDCLAIQFTILPPK
ncbi:hypothetical protein [Marinifilum sp. D714]|uniref:hypothetical protein n=1 Tax=Marinifilum sp. D714 TaxID=2937523 RepID=UPI0027CDD868|nr:hypothetical protein [Marinifilum sp. D714]MDQ2178854.1 hypothetical protein [Marinifilum sp. D714]